MPGRRTCRGEMQSAVSPGAGRGQVEGCRDSPPGRRSPALHRWRTGSQLTFTLALCRGGGGAGAERTPLRKDSITAKREVKTKMASCLAASISELQKTPKLLF